MALLGDLFALGSNFAGLAATKKKNKDAKAVYDNQKTYTDSQVGLADLIKQAALRQQAQGSGYTDAFGGGTTYDPATGTWKATLGAGQRAIQDASNSEELARNSGDAAIRRFGLGQADQLRQGYVGDADAARRSYNLFNQGVGAVDPNTVASDLELGRTRAVNAGFDDAQRAANTISLRTGASSGDALSRLARSRANAIATTAGNPQTEGLQFADGINNARRSNLFGAYTGFGDRGRDFADVGFNPSTFGQQSTDNLFRTQGLDLDKFNSTTGAFGNAASTIGAGAAGLRGADALRNGQTDYFGLSKFLKSTGELSNNVGADIAKMFSGMGG